MNLTVLVITDGRKLCFTYTMDSMYRNLHLQGGTFKIVVVDDSADPRYADWLDAHFPETTRIHHEERRGFGGAIQSGWDHLGDADWVFHLEDDFTFNRPVPMLDMIATLVGQPHLAQLVLRRQPVNDVERAAGGVIEQWPGEYTECNGPRGSWLEHRLFWSTNPSLYAVNRTLTGWPQVERSEMAFTRQLLRSDPDLRFAFWGRRSDEPWVEHIGTERVGTGY